MIEIAGVADYQPCHCNIMTSLENDEMHSLFVHTYKFFTKLPWILGASRRQCCKRSVRSFSRHWSVRRASMSFHYQRQTEWPLHQAILHNSWHYPPAWGSRSHSVERNLHNAIIMTGDHVGTHIDALCHVGNKGYWGVVAAEAYQGEYLRYWCGDCQTNALQRRLFRHYT
jgi:hypothetical protein